MDDQRRLRRAESDFRVQLASEEETAVWRPAVLVDCATGGLGVRTDSAWKVGDRVRIRISDGRMGTGSIALGVAEVTRVLPDKRAGLASGYRMGLKFIGPDTEAVERLYHLAQVQQAIRKRAVDRRNVGGRKAWG